MYDPETGKRTACTVLQLDRNEVVAHKRREINGYWAVQIGAGQKEARNVTKPMLGHFARAKVHPKRWMAEFKVRDEAGLQVAVGEMVGANWFSPGQWVDVQAVSRGMGFAGVSRALPCRSESKAYTIKLGHETARFRRPTCIARSITHASWNGFGGWFTGFGFACSPRQAHGWENG